MAKTLYQPMSAILGDIRQGVLEASHGAEKLLTLVLPKRDNPGADYYFHCARDWLTPLLTCEKNELTPELLYARVQGLCALSPNIKNLLGGLAGRLHLIVNYP